MAGQLRLLNIVPSAYRGLTLALTSLRSFCAPGWRVLARRILVAGGFCVFAALQFAIGYGITESRFFLVFVLVAGCAYTAIALVSPLTAMLIWIVVSPISTYVLTTRDPTGMNFVTFDTVTFFLLFFALVTRGMVNRVRMRRPHVGELALILFIVYVLFSIFIREQLTLNQLKVFTLRMGVWPFIFYYAKATVRTEADIRKYISAFMVGATVIGLSMIYEHFAGRSIYSVMFGVDIRLSWEDIGQGRATGPFRTPIHAPQLLIPTIFLAINAIWHSGTSWRRLVCAAVALIAAAGVLFTYTRNNYITLSIFLLAIPWLSVQRRRFYVGLQIATIVMVIATLPLVVTGDLYARLTKDTVTNRVLFMRTSIEVIKNNPWFGVGWGNSEEATKRYITSRKQYEGSANRKAYGVSTLGRPTLVHNTYLNITQENGAVGALLYYSAIVSLLVCALKAYSRAPVEDPLGKNFVAVVVVYVLAWFVATMAFNNDIANYANALFWIYLALAARYGEILSSKQGAGMKERTPANA